MARPSLGNMLANLDPPADPEPPVADSSSSSATKPKREPSSRPARRVRRSATKIRVGVWFGAGEWDRARAAFVADYANLGDAEDTFVGWLSRAVDDFTRLSPTARRKWVEILAGEERTVSRNFEVPEHVVETIQRGVGADRTAGYTAASKSEYVARAAAAAVAGATERNGGTLPPAPERLPSRGLG